MKFLCPIVLLITISLSVFSQTELYGNWRLETVNGEIQSGVINEYIFYENGLLLQVANRVDENGIQISDIYGMEMYIDLFGYTFSDETLILNNTLHLKAVIENDRLQLTDKYTVFLFKRINDENIQGTWISYNFSGNNPAEYIIDNNLKGTCTIGNTNNTEPISVVIEKITASNIIFHGKFLFHDYMTEYYFIMDGDRLLLFPKDNEHIHLILSRKE
ncbi:hypothetical protein K7I13_08640 [Brucepastera parasyntrophica]|uniref:hypothetical protein n=1 Tax=Brucepastera parasyntrophica TaxID=2880008 RepID=UPI00210867CC|nr:hypothetical protein [Brucepastera parasyntrophica]ULQ58629.1 hypothetical protein K7I13_08640 [Brucepastera parasyntrophica]